MDVQSSCIPALANTEHPTRDHIADAVYLPAALLDGIDLAAACTRRLLVTSWLLSGGEEDAHAARAAVAFWHGHREALLSWRAATVTTVLFDLQALGLVESFDAVPGGFSVVLKEVVN